MSSLLRATILTQFAISCLVDRTVARIGDREKGQASAEYAGIIIVAVTLVGLLITASNLWGAAIVKKITDSITKLGAAKG